jgi:hypothetical protein
VVVASCAQDFERGEWQLEVGLMPVGVDGRVERSSGTTQWTLARSSVWRRDGGSTKRRAGKVSSQGRPLRPVGRNGGRRGVVGPARRSSAV